MDGYVGWAFRSRRPAVAVVVVTVDMAAFEALLTDDVWTVADEAAAWLADPTRTAHPAVSLPTAELVAEALRSIPSAGGRQDGMSLPGGLWRVLPDRLLSLHPGRRTERLDRLRIGTPEHLGLTALVMERWGWAQSGGRIRTASGGRCILGAQRVVHALGYGTEVTAVEAGRRLNGVLRGRGIGFEYPQWNELSTTTGAMALGLVRAAAEGAR